MARQPLRLVYGSAAQVAAYAGPAREPVFNTDTGEIHVQDGATAGGIPMLRKDGGDGSAVKTRARGRNRRRAMADRAADVVAVLDFAPDGIAEADLISGAVDASATFQAAVNSAPPGAHLMVDVPAYLWRLDQNVVDNGRIVSWRVALGARFIGTGTLGLYQIPQYSGAGYDKRNSAQWLERGTSAAPLNDETPIDAVVKRSALKALRGSHNAARLSVHERLSGSTAYCQGSMSIAIDSAGGAGNGSFVEAHRGVAMVKGGTRGSAYGGISAAYSDEGTSPSYLIGHEADVASYDGASTPSPEAFNKDHFRAAFVASTLYNSDKPDAAYVVNPYCRVPFRTALYIGENSTDHTGVFNAASLNVFLYNGGSAYTGWVVGNVTGQAILMKNGAGSLIRVRNGANTSEMNVFYVDDTDVIHLGVDVKAVAVEAPLLAKVLTLTGSPNPQDFGSGFAAIVKNKSDGTVRICVNDGGVIKSSAPLT